MNGYDFIRMMELGAQVLKANVDFINGLNVFPVPDGDTGTNMNMTMGAGVEQLIKHRGPQIGKCAESLSKGLLMGARGNSGVILSQLFRGFAKTVHEMDEVDVNQFAAALQQGVDTAYQAVMRPVEGTILTVAREAAAHAVHIANRTDDFTVLMNEVLRKAKEALSLTPEQLPVLKEVGVVDSGGQGLVCLYEGFARFLNNERVGGAVAVEESPLSSQQMPSQQVIKAQVHLHSDDIIFPYDMEFFIIQNETSLRFDESAFRQKLEQYGDSILIIVEGNAIKVHVHSNAPGQVLNEAIRYGELTRFHIENMKETHRDIVAMEVHQESSEEQHASNAEVKLASVQSATEKSYGFVAVAAGKGITNIFRSLGVDEVLHGGQTMNPSTEDLLAAVEKVSASKVFILPNNSNIILTAEQVRDLSDREVIVLPTKTVPQGMAAIFAFRDHLDATENERMMLEAIGRVRSGSITESIRDTQMDAVTIRAGDYIGIAEGEIVGATDSLYETGKLLLDKIIESEDDIVTILTGELATQECTESLLKYVEQQHPEVEVEVHTGGQPVYHYIISVES